VHPCRPKLGGAYEERVDFSPHVEAESTTSSTITNSDQRLTFPKVVDVVDVVVT